MLAFTALALSSVLAVANAHFQLQFPPPRGVFVQDSEPTFCDGYNSPANRTSFPLTGGFLTLNSEHPSWTAGIFATSKANPTNFSDFSTTVTNFFQDTGEGVFCFPINLSSFSDGQNVTIEVIFNGGDGQLYQCADLTVSKSATIASDIACTNATSSGSSAAASASRTATGSAATSSTTAPSAGQRIQASVFGLGLAALAIAFVA
ncbi:unnamed protein product [Mycena citricolor]|uniref:Copper acquisition factor BIM1-like domain-containing protein n=1 Tax=Mycena citricolor TaxID=2018698 RepID=A0AAD2HQH0_9AGAR|nr:unnamed protein product [Mycena citricolor]